MNTGDEKLDEMIAKAEAWYAALTPEQKVAHDRAQAISWMHGETRISGHDLTEEQCAAIYDKHRADTRIAELTHQRDTLAREIAEAAQRLGGYNGEVPLTGPQVMLLLKDMEEQARNGIALRKSMEAIVEAKSPPHRSGSPERHIINALEASEAGRSYALRDDEDWRRPDENWPKTAYPPGPTEVQPAAETRMATAPQAGDGAEVV